MLCGPTTHRLGLDGGRTIVARTWAGEGVPIVFLHGLFGSSQSWAGLAASLGRPTVALDLPGFGESDLPLSADLSAYVDDVAAALAQLGVEGFELVGHSFGGAVAAALAQRVPDEVRSLLLLAPAGFGRIAQAELATAPLLGRVVEALMPRRLARRGIACSRPLLDAARQATRALVAAGRETRRAASYAGPVTALWGTDDHVVPPVHSRGVTATFPHAQVLLWTGMGHHPLAERHDALLDLLATGRSPRAGATTAPATPLSPSVTPKFA